MEKTRVVRNPWSIVLLIVALSIGVAWGISALARNVGDENHLGEYKALNIVNIQDLQTTKDGFVYYDGNTVSAIASSGKVKWSYLVGAGAQIDVGKTGVAAWSGKVITLIDLESGSTIFNGTMAQDIISAHIGEKYTAVVIGEMNNSIIVIMENSGSQVNQIAMDSVTVIDYGFFTNGSLLWTMICDSNGTVPTCDIQTYRPGKEIVGSIKDSEQLAYAVMFQSTQICVAGDTYLKTYDYTGTETVGKRKLVYGWYLQDADETSLDPLMAFVNDAQRKGNSAIQDVRLIRSDLDRVVHMPFGCLDVVAMGDTLYGFSADGHLMMMQQNVSAAECYKLEIPIDRVYGVTKDGVAVVSSMGAVCLVELG